MTHRSRGSAPGGLTGFAPLRQPPAVGRGAGPVRVAVPVGRARVGVPLRGAVPYPPFHRSQGLRP
ncbi:hypothetical protein Slala02_25950 [Streptomyces lavendulae subsp. lavendulae]|nr:hypothetical protein Slala02_25950 [Streptomyces lavendulae subsp. lavendulae]